MRTLLIGLVVLIAVAAIWFFAIRPAVACWERGGQPVRGFFDNVECVESR